mmetsp:Transcript_21687/g.43851  ORF Transcript_21687/g.43851 Transcript_21687/m.43851 type:complete len:93 (-) Transcript_21687:427-705(-)
MRVIATQMVEAMVKENLSALLSSMATQGMSNVLNLLLVLVNGAMEMRSSSPHHMMIQSSAGPRMGETGTVPQHYQHIPQQYGQLLLRQEGQG